MKLAKISQSELARRIGVTQPTIYRLVHGQAYGSTHLHRIARELGTTPAYLSGETDDPNSDDPDLPELSFQHRQLLDGFDVLDRDDRAAVLHLILSLAGRGGGGTTVHAPRSSYRGG